MPILRNVMVLLAIGIFCLFIMSNVFCNAESSESIDLGSIDKLLETKDTAKITILVNSYLSRPEFDLELLKQTIEKLIMADQLDLALSTLTSVISKYPDQKNFILLRASVYLFKQQLKEANADLSRYLESNPKHVQALSFRAENYVNLKEYELANHDFTILISLEPNQAKWYCARGETYSHLEMYDEALQDFDKALNLDSQNVRAFDGMEYAQFKVFKESVKP